MAWWELLLISLGAFLLFYATLLVWLVRGGRREDARAAARFIPECILLSGIQREESRGAHQRTDFPARDDERFLTHLMVRRNPDGTARVEHFPVTITRWPPGERIYGR